MKSSHRKRGKKGETSKDSQRKNGMDKESLGSPIKKKRGRPSKETIKTRLNAKPKQFRKALEGLLLTYGEGDMGQLGIENVQSRKKPAVIPDLADVKVDQVACGGLHTCVLTNEDKVFTYGCNDEAALGRSTDDQDEEMVPAEIDLTLPDTKVFKITAGDSHSALLTADGRVYVWGCFRDSHGKLGMFKEKEVWSTPTQIPLSHHFKSDIVDIVSGCDHILLLTDAGKVYSLGNGEQGQLGNVPEHNCDRSVSGRVKPESRFLTPRRVAFPSYRTGGKMKLVKNIARIFCGPYTSYAVTTTNAVFSWGLNNFGQLGLAGKHARFTPTYSESLSSIEIDTICGGHYHTVVLSKQGEVYTLGRGEDGRLGLGKEVTQCDEPSKISTLSDVTAIATGDNVSYALNKDGVCFGWGFGTNLQLTNSYKDEDDEWVTNDEYSPYQINGKQLETRKIINMDAGSQHVCLISKDV